MSEDRVSESLQQARGLVKDINLDKEEIERIFGVWDFQAQIVTDLSQRGQQVLNGIARFMGAERLIVPVEPKEPEIVQISCFGTTTLAIIRATDFSKKHFSDWNATVDGSGSSEVSKGKYFGYLRAQVIGFSATAGGQRERIRGAY